MKFLNNRIYFIESLTGNHKQSADDLYNYHISRYFDGNSIYKTVETKQELFEYLDQILKEVESGNVFPLIHIEAHGLDSKKGLELRSTEIIYWKNLTKIFQEINEKTCNNLMLCISACSSIYVLEEIINSFYEFGSSTPFFTFVGTEDTIEVEDLSNAFPEFYKKFHESKSIIASVKHMNKYSKTKFRTDNCHSIFKICADGFCDSWIKERAQRISSNPSLLNSIYCNLYSYTYGKDCGIEMISELMISEQLYIDFFNKRMADFFLYDCEGSEQRFGNITKINNFEKCQIYMRTIN